MLTHGHEDHVGRSRLPPAGRVEPRSTARRSRSASRATAHRRGGARPDVDLDRRSPTASGGTIGPFDVEFIPVTHSVPHGFAIGVPHAPGRDPALRRLQARPDARRRAQDRPRPDRRDRRDGGHPPAALGLDERGGAGLHAAASAASASRFRQIFTEHPGRRIVVACFASHVHRIQQLARRRRRERAQGRAARPLDAAQRRARPRARAAHDPGVGASSTSRTSTTSTPARSASSRPAPRASRCRRSRSWPRARTGGSQVARRRRRGALQPRHPRQRVGGRQGDGRAGPPRAPRSSTPAIAHVHESGHAKQGELATLLAVARPHVLHPGARRVPAPAPPRPPGDRDGRGASERAPVRGRRRGAARPTTASTSSARCPPATSSSTASSATSAAACCATAGCSPRRASSSSSSPSTSVRETSSPGPEIITRGWVHAPEAEELIEDARAAVVKAVARRWGAASWDADALRRVTRRAVGRIVSERTRRRPMIVPVVMEA